MCGLAGFIGFNNKRELAENANRTQLHRGPDNQSAWSDDHIALAHQRLSIIDLSENANQPFCKYDLIIVFNGEIYNYKDLQAKLKKEKQTIFLTNSDTEVILEMYYHYGAKCLDYFEGMFAFAIYDTENKSLFVARDHFGIKPLFYTTINNNFAFSSELKTLVKIPDFDKAINYKSLISSLNYLWVSSNETMFENCFKLPPAHYMIINKNLDIRMQRYWELKDEDTTKFSEKEYIEKLTSVLEESIKKHMVADVPVSSFLSGGLDSSLISVLAQKYNPNLSTYTIGTTKHDKKIEKMPEDEKYAKKLAQLHNFDHNEIIIRSDIVKILPQMVKTLDEPIGDPAAINTYLICEAAKQKGVKVLLSGMGADEIFFGYRRQKATLLAMQYQHLPKFIRNITETIANILPVKIFNRGIKFSRWVKRFLSFASLPPEKAYMRSYSYYDKEELYKLLKNQHMDEIELLYKEHKDLYESKYKTDPVNQICYTDINMFMLGLNLTYSDRASMAASVEIRVPFIDKNVVEYAMTIPGKLKIKKWISKYIFKKVATKFLPNDIIYRPKASFGAPIRSWISNDLKEMVNTLLSKENIEKRGIFNYDFINQIIEDDRKGKEDNAYRIYQLLTIELWFREFVNATK